MPEVGIFGSHPRLTNGPLEGLSEGGEAEKRCIAHKNQKQKIFVPHLDNDPAIAALDRCTLHRVPLGVRPEDPVNRLIHCDAVGPCNVLCHDRPGRAAVHVHDDDLAVGVLLDAGPLGHKEQTAAAVDSDAAGLAKNSALGHGFLSKMGQLIVMPYFTGLIIKKGTF